MLRKAITLTLLGISSVLLAETSSMASAIDRAQGPQESSSQPVNPPVNVIVQWNRILLAIVRTPGAQPATIHPTRSFAMMHAAIYDAVNAIERSHKPYAVRLSDVSPHASQDAAAAAAAHDMMVALYPQFQSTLDAQLQDSLAQITDGSGQADGVRVGQTVAALMLDVRKDDGSSATPIPYLFGTDPGDYQSTPPNFPQQPQFTHWPHVTPFALTRAELFRPGPPPQLTGDRYGDAVNEVKSLGVVNGTASSPDQALTGRFWNGAIQNYWNEIAQTVTDALHLSTAERARLFALLNLTFADTVISFYDAKYTYNFWRPVTAIRAADSVGNPDNASDPNWLPEVGNTTPDPSYPGAHAAISAAALDVFLSVFRRDRFELTVTSEVLPGVTRSFASFSAAADEATLSRIFAGVHFRFDLTTGIRLGRRVADFVVDNFLTGQHADDERDRDDLSASK